MKWKSRILAFIFSWSFGWTFNTLIKFWVLKVCFDFKWWASFSPFSLVWTGAKVDFSRRSWVWCWRKWKTNICSKVFKRTLIVNCLAKTGIYLTPYQGPIVSGHVFFSWSNTSNSACCFGDALRCVPFSWSKHGASQSALGRNELKIARTLRFFQIGDQNVCTAKSRPW